MKSIKHLAAMAWLLGVLSAPGALPVYAADPPARSPATAPAQVKGEYTDPDGLFAIRMPEGFKAQRERSEIGMSTILTKEGDPAAAVPRIEFITLTGGSAIDPTHLEQM